MRHHRGALTLVVLTLILSTACSGGTASEQEDPVEPTSLVRGDRIDPEAAEALLAEFADLDHEARQRRATEVVDEVQRSAWQISGLEEAVGGATEADTIFATLEQRMRATLVQQTERLGPARAFGRSPALPSDDLGEAGAMGLFGAMMVSALGARSAAGLPNGRDTGSETNDGFTRTASKDTGSVKVSRSTTQRGVELRIDTSSTVRPCPDASGQVVAEGSMGATTHQGNTGHSFTYAAKVKIQVNDDAEIASETHELRAEQADYAGGKGHYVDVSVSQNGDYVVKRARGDLPENYVRDSAVSALFLGYLLVDQLKDAAEEMWKSGACVQLEPTVDKGPTGLEPSAAVAVTAAPRSKMDGGPVGGTVTAVLSGGGASVAPAGSKVGADATFTYSAPPEKDKTGDVAFEARSKRGVAKASTHFDTYELSFVAEGGSAEFNGKGRICSLTRPFTISGSGLTLEFTPQSESRGRYVLSGRAGGVPWSGGGTYQVKLNASRNGGTLSTTGTNTITSPLGAFSDQAEARFTLDSVASCS